MGWISDLVSGGPARMRPPSFAGRSFEGKGALPPPGPKEVQIATAVLLIEVSAADHEVDPREREAIVAGLESAFGLSPDETAEVVEVAGNRSADSISLYEFTRLVDRAFTPEQKGTVIELLFRVAFADGRLAGEEEHLIRKAATLLHVERPAYLAAKTRARTAHSEGAE